MKKTKIPCLQFFGISKALTIFNARKLLLLRFIQPLAILSILLITPGILACSGQTGADSVSITISDITVSETTETGAIISWTTEEPVVCTVVYGEST